MAEKRTKFVSFNICGIKGILSRAAQWVPERTFRAMLDHLDADVACFQETKIQASDITKDMALVPGFNAFFTSSTGRKGYSGVVMYVRDSIRVLKAEEGLTGWLTSTPGGTPYRNKRDSLGPGVYPENFSQADGIRMDEQGRVLTIDLGACVVIGCYCPADSQGNMGDYKNLFYQLLDWRVSRLLELGRSVIVMGDLNVAREPQDSAPIREELRKIAGGVIDEEQWKYGSVSRKAVNDWIEQDGFQDTSRAFHPDNGAMYTCWDQQKNARPANFGSRIDYILASSGLQCVDADIMPDLVGSDHCPLYATLLLDVESQGSYPLPALNRKCSGLWSQDIKSFFRPRESKPPLSPPAKLLDDQHHKTLETASAAVLSAAVPSTADPSTVALSVATRSVEAVPAAEALETLIAEEGKPISPQGPASNAKPESPLMSPTILSRGGSRSTSPRKADSSNDRLSGKGITKSSGQMSVSKFFAMKSDRWREASAMKVPVCQHGEDCIIKRSSKPPRKGEYFWMCARPHGGKANAGGEFRCKTFIWDTERKRQH